ncbi:MAG: hypothetical protein COX17_09090 [Deltaproteobacteria bacterium CG23_combo_of_CG06-09_8_20_14_all_60_8]|nr:MAG: hypothetical protein COX17_09090 [Deltaproteobacteria bacterium CG23_combo_of_CG06-09_8_20_14_all_60_8]
MMVANLKKNRFPMDDILAADSVPNRLQPNCLNNLINHKRLKIAVLIRDFVTTGGAERYACEVTRRLAREHEVHVFCQNWDATVSEVIAFHRIPKPLAKPSFVNQLLFSFFTRRALASARPAFDIVHSHDKVTAFDLLTIHCPCFRGFITDKKTWLSRLLIWLSVITSPRSLGYLGLEKGQFTLRPDRRLIAVSTSVKEDVQHNYPLPGSFFSLAQPGADYEQIRAVVDMADRQALRQQYHFGPDDFVLLFVGTEFKRKGLATLLAAMAKLDDQRVRLLVAGGGGGKMQIFKQLAQDLGLADRVAFAGLVRDVFPLYALADLFVLPTISDPCPMSPVEAMAGGLATIMSRSPFCGTAEHIRQDEALILQDPTDLDELVAAIRQGMDRDCRAQLQEKGQRLAQTLSWEKTAAATLEAYQQLLDARPPKS